VSTAAPSPEIVVRPAGRWGALDLSEVWAYRELLYFLTKRELQVRYKQSLLGVSWALMQPLALTFIFALFFGRLVKVPSDGIPYPLFALSGLVSWLFVSQGTMQAAQSLVADANLLTKVYFPRVIVPLAKVLALLVDLVIALIVLVVFAVIYDVAIQGTAVLVPLFLLLGLATALGAGVLLAALNVKYRDVGVAVPLAVQVWLFATPVVYPASLVSGGWQYVYAINPMVSIIGGMRWALFGTTAPAAGAVAVSAGVACILLAAAVIYFRRTERFFADLV
jgi:homopolymeric O-antigen transport system permease protein